MKHITLAIMAIAGLAGATTAFASSSGWYVLGAIGQDTKNDTQLTQDNILKAAGKTGFQSSYSRGTVYKLQLGNQINKNFAIEGGYITGSNARYSATGGNLTNTVTGSGSVNGWNVNAVGILPIANQFSLLGKLGAASIRTPGIAGNSISYAGQKTALTYGVGAKYDGTRDVSLRLDLDSYDSGTNNNNDGRSSIWTMGVGLKF